ncbi:hypothetical protein SLS54_006015 [Diplodia seriata]
MMYSIQSMEPTESVVYVHTFVDLAALSGEERLALTSLKHVVQLKSFPPETFEYMMPANVFKAFAPEMFKQAFQLPGEAEDGRRSVLMLPHSGTDPAALKHICDWMVQSCSQTAPFRLQAHGNFFAWVELMKASMLLQVHAAQATVWPKLAHFITKEALEWQHVESIMNNFDLDSKVVKHLIHNVSFRRNSGDITPSCEFFINHNEFFKGLVDQVADQQHKSAIASANANQFARWNQNNAAYRRQRFEEDHVQHNEQPTFHYPNQSIDRRRFVKDKGHGSRRYNVNANAAPQRREDMEGWAHRTAAAATWDDSPASHQGGAYDVRVLKPGEATAGGLVA